MKRKIIFETQRLIVREWQSEDEVELKKFLQDENVMYAYEHAFSDEEVANWLKWNLQSYQEYGYGLWALEKKRTGEVMNPYYEEVRQAIDKNKVNDLTAERIAEIQAKFKEGTEKYELMLKKVGTLKPTPQVLGIHKKFQHAYTEYVAGCNEMILATDPETGIDAELFNASEEKQDQATDELTFAITRMSNILLKK